MSEFELDEAAVADTEQELFQTGEKVNTEAAKARDSVTGARGAWLGDSNVAATNKQTGEFADCVNRLHNEINQMSEALGLGRKATMAEDQFNQDEFLAISPDTPYARV
ncbi:hypothetical protein JQS43_02835 [Natronosporangium hydrolyticum]|uniref:WXG100 family type VII secretion target n=1 Tax=Natronosporangium hydrolyticum TaxID=2811111 RepID=A0A895YKY0_9ACTN|nr:hypothetical protein [Natronosporangium hydrolyticum]QSB15316.1 hypothetical protein JQS43_02835 [Natronosporangium hydrolyticum]